MHLNRRGKGLIAKQLASEIWNLSAAQEMPPISLKWKAVQEQILSSCALGLEAGKAEGLIDELKTVPDKLVVFFCFFVNPLLFASCTNTFSKWCKITRGMKRSAQ
jgi:hypothetical protein